MTHSRTIVQLMKSIPAHTVPYVSSTLCRLCERCVARKACPSGAVVVLERGEQPWIDASRCQGCRACVIACSFGAVLLPHSEQSPLTTVASSE